MKNRQVKRVVPTDGIKQKLTTSVLVTGLILTLFVMTGCAHRTKSANPMKNGVSVAEPQTSSFTQTDTTPKTEEALVRAVETDEDDFESVDEGFDKEFGDEFGDAFEEEQITIADPLEPVNRAIFAFNDKLYFWVLKPVTKAFKAIVPEEIRTSTGNALHNIKAPVRIANSFLQGKFKQAGTEFGRFFVNSTVGVLGLGDPAAEHPVFEHDREDLGQTLAVWGIKDGVYLVLPLLGPSTLRDAVGRVGDMFLNPLRYGLEGTTEELGVRVYEQINEFSFRLGQYEAVKEGSLDPYVFMKNAYLQIRQDKITR